MASHVVRTIHIQLLIKNGLRLAELVNGCPLYADVDDKPTRVEDVLEKAAADLRHAAEELEAERLSVKGWRQV